MDRRDQPEYEMLRKVAASLKDECIFHAGFGDASQQMHPPGIINKNIHEDCAIIMYNKIKKKSKMNLKL